MLYMVYEINIFVSQNVYKHLCVKFWQRKFPSIFLPAKLLFWPARLCPPESSFHPDLDGSSRRKSTRKTAESRACFFISLVPTRHFHLPSAFLACCFYSDACCPVGNCTRRLECIPLGGRMELFPLVLKSAPNHVVIDLLFGCY